MTRDLRDIYYLILVKGWKVIECGELEGNHVYKSYKIVLRTPNPLDTSKLIMVEDNNKTFYLRPYPPHRSACVGYNPYIDEILSV